MSGSPACSLVELAHLVDDAHVDHPSDVAFYVVHEPPDIVLGLHALEPDLHPCAVLAGFEAPEAWDAFGVRVHGTARFLDEPDRPPEPIVSTFVLDRSGASASLLRRGDDVTELPGPAVGRVPDLCRSVLPTRPVDAPRAPSST